MKIRIVLKDPDTLLDAISDARFDLVNKLVSDHGLTKDGAEAEASARIQKMIDFSGKYFKYGEYLAVELDDEENTITVLESNAY
jgi:hypothetical protein